MTRSSYTNALIRKIVEVAAAENMVLQVDDDGENHICTTFEEVAEVVDSVDQSFIDIQNADKYAWFHLILCNDDDEQLCDYTANDFTQGIVDSVFVPDWEVIGPKMLEAAWLALEELQVWAETDPDDEGTAEAVKALRAIINEATGEKPEKPE